MERSMALLVFIVLVCAAVGSGLIAGVFFAFSTFIMRAFERLPAEQGAAAMRSINRVILRSLFMPLFFGCAALSVVLIFAWHLQWADTNWIAVLAGVVFYIVGVFLCTIAFNVPQNVRLEALSPTEAVRSGAWKQYLSVWTGWNHVRTLAALAASAAFAAAAVGVQG
jgi:uncharacterized membrane protein